MRVRAGWPRPAIAQRWVRSLVACFASTIDRGAISRTLPVVGVEVDSRRCGSLVDTLRPYLLKVHGVRAIRKGEGDDRKLVLLDALKLDDGELPPRLHRAVEQADGRYTSCDVHLGYNDLSANEVLQELLPADVGIPRAYESVGHVIHINLRPEQLPYKHVIGEVLLDKHAPRIRTVVNKGAEITSQYRNLPLELIAGEDDLLVTVQHGDVRLSFDYSKVYWSSRLHTEHQRMAASFTRGEVVWDLCAGVGPFAMLAARRGVTVLANDLNPEACSAMLGNVRDNGVLRHVHVYNLDAAAFVQAAVTSSVDCTGHGGGDGLAAVRLRDASHTPTERHAVERAAEAAEALPPDHILLNLPADSVRFLSALRPLRSAARQGPRVHCYSFSKLTSASERLREARSRASAELGFEPEQLEVRHVRNVAPGKEMLCYEFTL